MVGAGAGGRQLAEGTLHITFTTANVRACCVCVCVEHTCVYHTRIVYVERKCIFHPKYGRAHAIWVAGAHLHAQWRTVNFQLGVVR